MPDNYRKLLLTERLDLGSLALVLGNFGHGVISGAKEGAGASTYPQLIPGTTGTRRD